jgi:3',5'-cyclic AMP phosphodiesterase CpdA
MAKFLRLVHVSDLHFGDDITSSSWKRPPVSGLAVHDLNVAAALTDSAGQLRLLEPLAERVVATGDLTTWGRGKAFHTALTFLRSQHVVSALKRVGLDDRDAPVVPGNHDIWSAMSLHVLSRVGIPLSTRKRFDRYFDPPAPTHTLHSGNYFPYGVRLDAGPVKLYLYGLDSNRMEQAPSPLLHSFLASGFVPTQQLDELEHVLLPQELNEPRIRVAALHHPLAYKSVGSAPPGPVKKLLNLTEVLFRLQRMGFAIALVGHEHAGFARQESLTSSLDALHVFSSGTATQRVHHSAAARRLLAAAPATLSPRNAELRESVLESCNEYRAYEFEADPGHDFVRHAPPTSALTVNVRVFKYLPHLFGFAEVVHPASAPVRLGHYVLR